MWREVENDTTEEDNSKNYRAVNGRQTDGQDPKWSEGNVGGVDKKDNASSQSVSILANLIGQAELARAQSKHLCSKQTTRHRRRSGHKGQSSQTKRNLNCQATKDDSKPHIFRAENNTRGIAHFTKTKSTIVEPTSSKTQSEDTEGVPGLSSVPIILSTRDVSPSNLKAQFGDKYGEADCQPRRFCINISEEVRSILSTSRGPISTKYSTYIVFISAGVVCDGQEVFRVTANCAACTEPGRLTHSIPCVESNTESVINMVVGNLLDLKEAGHLSFDDDNLPYTKHATTMINELIMDKLRVEMDVFFTSDALSSAEKTGKLQGKREDAMDPSNSLIELVTDSQFEMFCEICFENVNPAKEEALHGTELNACGHLFCDGCWIDHLRRQVREGTLQLTCPGPQCSTNLGLSTLLSLLHVTEVARMYQRACEADLNTCPAAKACPGPNCGRIIKLNRKLYLGDPPKIYLDDPPERDARDLELTTKTIKDKNSVEKSTTVVSEDTPVLDGLCLSGDTPVLDGLCLSEGNSLDVTCVCGENWCFACLSPAHWPARCGQAKLYLDKMETLRLDADKVSPNHDADTPSLTGSSPETIEPLEVEGRLCPKCRRFIEKDGGGWNVTCLCGHQFCWTCLRACDYSHSQCTPNPATVRAFTRRVLIRHLTQSTSDGDFGHCRARSGSLCLESSMYHKAFCQRQEAARDRKRRGDVDRLISKVCKATRKDSKFKEEVLTQCAIPRSDAKNYPGASEISRDARAQICMYQTVTRYLRSCFETQQELRRLAEYTYVLLQDCPASAGKRRASRVVSDMTAFCSFSSAVLHAGRNQDPRGALKRLSDIRAWASRAVDALLAAVQRLKH